VADQKKERKMSAYASNNKRGSHGVQWAVAFLVLAMLACAVEFGPTQKPPTATEVPKVVEGTVAVQSPTVQPVPSQALSMQQTVQVQQATIDSQATLLAQPSGTLAPAQEPAAPSTVPPVSDEPIPLTEWKSNWMRQAPGCGKDPNGPPCWYGSASGLYLTMKKPVLIDPDWPNPHLIFSHSNYLIYALNACTYSIYVQVDGQWQTLWSIPREGGSAWRTVRVDLTKYKGQEILIQFSTDDCYTEWYIRDIQIDPNYSEK
jgi:hypothetical protein